MKHPSAALLAAFLLLLSACGTNSTNDVEATAGAEQSSVLSLPATDGESQGDASADTAGADQQAQEADSDDQAQEADNDAADEAAEDIKPSEAPAVTLGAAMRSANSSAAMTSGRFEASITMIGAEGSETPGEFSVAINGAYDDTLGTSQIAMDMSGLADLALSGDAGDELGFMAAFFEDEIEMITIGDQAWVRWSLLTMFTGTADKWLESDGADASEVTSDFAVGGAPLPTELFDQLADANVQVEEVGDEEIRGVTTVHYRFTVDLETLAQSMSDADWEELESTIGATPIGNMPMDVWLDDEGRLHRYLIDLSDLGSIEPEDDLVGIRMLFEIWDHGADVGITPPPADQIITSDELTFGFGETEDYEDYGDIAG